MGGRGKGATGTISEQTYLVLLALAGGPLHGYGIIARVAELSRDRVRLGAGTLYGALSRLLEAGWIRRVGGPHRRGAEPPRTRKAYELTALGSSVVGAETARLWSLIDAAERAGRPVGGRVAAEAASR